MQDESLGHTKNGDKNWNVILFPFPAHFFLPFNVFMLRYMQVANAVPFSGLKGSVVELGYSH